MTTETVKKIRVRKIELLWSENVKFCRLFGHEPRKPVAFMDFEEVNSFLRSMAREGPELGYDKTGYRVTWEDDFSYQGRYDLHTWGKDQENPSGQVDLADQIRGQWKVYTGQHRPAHLSPERYEALLKFHGCTETVQEYYRVLLENYEL